MGAHLINSIIFTLFYAAALYPLFPLVGLSRGGLISGVLGGIGFGVSGSSLRC